MKISMPVSIKAFSLGAIILCLGACDNSAVVADAVDADNNETQANQLGSEMSIVYFDQGWTRAEAADFYRTSQGSQLIPYAWFLALEQAGNNNLFRDDQNIKKFGYIPQTADTISNPDGLPIGFVKDASRGAILGDSAPQARLPNNGMADDNTNGSNEWLGLTCAACHTAQISYQNKPFRIDGGQPLADMQSMLKEMKAALIATHEDDAKLTRFAKRVLNEGGYNDTEKMAVKSQIEHYTKWLDGYVSVNYKGLLSDYGYGRLDAFGAILNRVTSTLLENPDNGTPANAPVSYPYLWNTGQLDWVQWNGSVNNHIARNIGEVTGVFARTVLTTDNEQDRFYSSANLRNLDRLEQLMGQLDSPKWRQAEAMLPAIDEDKALKGKALFAQNCQGCHGVRDETNQFPLTEPNDFGMQFIQVSLTPLAEIGTDPLTAVNFVSPEFDAQPDQMRPFIVEDAVAAALAIGKAKGLSETELAQLQAQTQLEFEQKERVPRAMLLSTASSRIIKRKFAEAELLDQPEILLSLSGYRNEEKKPEDLLVYRGRPLNGIWATAPYMHNGSMSNLYQTLLPDEERETSFYVGGTEFDPVNVGFISSETANRFLFRTLDDAGNPIPGNSNAGHSGNGFTKTLNANGEWVNFSDEQRYELIEYMKTL